MSMDRQRFESRLIKLENKPNQLQNLKNNCDPKLFVDILKQTENLIYLEHEQVEIMGYKIFGTPYVPPCGDWAFILKQEERRSKFKEIPDDTDILVTHTPPYAILDGERNHDPSIPESKRRFGCKELREEILTRIQPLYNIFGHNHDGYGQMEVEGIKFINAASCDNNYQAENPPIYFDLPFKQAEHLIPNVQKEEDNEKVELNRNSKSTSEKDDFDMHEDMI